MPFTDHSCAVACACWPIYLFLNNENCCHCGLLILRVEPWFLVAAVRPGCPAFVHVPRVMLCVHRQKKPARSSFIVQKISVLTRPSARFLGATAGTRGAAPLLPTPPALPQSFVTFRYRARWEHVLLPLLRSPRIASCLSCGTAFFPVRLGFRSTLSCICVPPWLPIALSLPQIRCFDAFVPLIYCYFRVISLPTSTVSLPAYSDPRFLHRWCPCPSEPPLLVASVVCLLGVWFAVAPRFVFILFPLSLSVRSDSFLQTNIGISAADL
jgi:hypothetical protein